MLTNSDSIFIEQVDGGFNFATENTPIHEAMPLLYDQKTNGQIAREACEAFYQVGTVSPTRYIKQQHSYDLNLQNNTFILSSRWLRHILKDQKDTWIQRETIQPSLLFRSLQILLDNYDPQTPGAILPELANLFTCAHLDRLEIEICTPETLADDPERMKQWSLGAATAIGAVVRQLMEKFGTAVKVLVGGPFARQGKEDVTWMYTF